jgi:hypothetical protein
MMLLLHYILVCDLFTIAQLEPVQLVLCLHKIKHSLKYIQDIDTYSYRCLDGHYYSSAVGMLVA